MTEPENTDVMVRIKRAATQLIEPPWHLLKGEFIKRRDAREQEIEALMQQSEAHEQEALNAATEILTRHSAYVPVQAKHYQEAIHNLLEVKDEKQ